MRRGIGALDFDRLTARETIRFEFTSDSSSKFWQLTKTSRQTYLAEWGCIGSPPQAQKEYDEHEARKKVAEKIGKGYQQVTPPPSEQIAAKMRMDKKREEMAKKKKIVFDFMAELRSIKNEED